MKLFFALLSVVFGRLFGQITPLTSVILPPVPEQFEARVMVADWSKNELYTANGSSVIIIDTIDWNIKKNIPLSFKVAGLCVSPNGTFAIPTNSKTIAILDPDGSLRFLDSGLFITSDCSFSADGKKLFISSNLRESPNQKKISAIDTETWSIAQTWSTDENSIPTLQTSSNGKVYLLSQYLPNTTGNLKILNINGSITTVDIGFMPKTISIAPNGRAYIQGAKNTVAIDIDSTGSDQIVDRWPIFFGGRYRSFPSDDPWFCYDASLDGGISGANIAQKITVLFWQPNGRGQEEPYGLASQRQSNGDDIIAVRRAGRIDIFKAAQPSMLYAVVSAADFKSGPLAPGNIASLFGAKFSTETAVFSAAPPLPNRLAGTSVVMNGGQLVPLFYVSPNQINIQIPFETAGDKVTLQIVTPQGSTNTISVPLVSANPRPFSGPNGNVLVDQTGHWTKASIVAGQVAMMFATGLGQVSPSIATGFAAPLSPLSYVSGATAVTLCGQSAQILFSGLAPMFVSLYQINLVVPNECATGQTEDAQITVN